tara:strand:+ start:65 stop:268 length:204 start_codon:yes stop_codon:yes gene_type:complete
MTYTYTNTNKWTEFKAVSESGTIVSIAAGAVVELEDRLVGDHPDIVGEFAPVAKAKSSKKKSSKKSD